MLDVFFIWKAMDNTTQYNMSDKLNFDPVIIIGSPRSGTSTVARILQENLGFMIDEGPIRRDWRNPDGYYEDQKLIAINNIVLRNWKVGTNNQERINMQWAIQFAKWISNRAYKYERWGFKEPRMVGFIHWTLQFLKNPIFIWTIRRDAQIIQSQVEKFGYDMSIAKKGVEAYRKLINKHLNQYNLHKIDLKKHKTDEQICEELRIILNGCC